MLNILGLLTGWVLLAPLLFVIYLWAGGPYIHWMAPLAGIAVSIPVLAFSTVAGIALMFFSARGLARRPDPLMPPR
jgi:hypothetical protein